MSFDSNQHAPIEAPQIPKHRIEEHCYVSPPPWRVVETDSTLEIQPKQRPDYLQLGCCLAVCFIASPLFGLWGSFVAGSVAGYFFAAFLFVGGICATLIMVILYRIEANCGPWLIVNRDSREMFSPRTNKKCNWANVLQFQGIYGRIGNAHRSSFAELNLVVAIEPAQIHRWPIVGTSSVGAIQELGDKLQIFSGIPFVLEHQES